LEARLRAGEVVLMVAEGLELVQEPHQVEGTLIISVGIDMHTIQRRPLVVFCESITDFMAAGKSNTAKK
jgi:hypothetical protein